MEKVEENEAMSLNKINFYFKNTKTGEDFKWTKDIDYNILSKKSKESLRIMLNEFCSLD